MNDRTRLIRGISANLMALATRIAVQFATLPIFFASWNVERVGTWLIFFAVPAYVALVGTGFAGAGGTAALAAAQRGDIARARQDFRAAWAISAGATAVLALIFAAASVVVIPSVVEPGGELAQADVIAAAGWLAIYIFATSQMAIFEIPYRVVSRYPDHMLLYNGASLLEIGVIAVSVVLSDSLANLAMALAVLRCLSALWIYRCARRDAPKMFERGRESARDSLPHLWRPALTFMLAPLIFGLNLQGYLFVVGASFGAVVLAGFAATRTLTRLLDLVTNFTYAMQFYESGYLGEQRREVQQRMLSTMSLVSLSLAVAFAACLLSFGHWLQDVYTVGKTTFSASVALVLWLAGTMRALSSAPIAILTADNAHSRVVVIYLVASASSLLLAFMLGLAGMSLAIVLLPLVLAEGTQFVTTMQKALAALDFSLRDFLRSLASRDRLRDVERLWRLVSTRS